MFKELLSRPGTLTIQTRVCTLQIILLCWTRVPCDLIIKRRIMPLKRFPKNFPLDISLWIRKFEPIESNIQYAVISTLLQHLWLIYNKCIRNTSYTLSKGPGRDKLVMSCTYSSFSLVENLKVFLLMLMVFLLCIFIF